MSKNFEIVLYYQKRVIIGGKPSLETLIETKKKSDGFDEDDENDMNSLLDEYSADIREVGSDNIVDTWILIEEDSSFLDNVNKIQKNEHFISWSTESTDMIQSKIAKV
jgi:hypothetical protein